MYALSEIIEGVSWPALTGIIILIAIAYVSACVLLGRGIRKLRGNDDE